MQNILPVIIALTTKIVNITPNTLNGKCAKDTGELWSIHIPPEISLPHFAHILLAALELKKVCQSLGSAWNPV